MSGTIRILWRGGAHHNLIAVIYYFLWQWPPLYLLWLRIYVIALPLSVVRPYLVSISWARFQKLGHNNNLKMKVYIYANATGWMFLFYSKSFIFSVWCAVGTCYTIHLIRIDSLAS